MIQESIRISSQAENLRAESAFVKLSREHCPMVYYRSLHQTHCPMYSALILLAHGLLQGSTSNSHPNKSSIYFSLLLTTDFTPSALTLFPTHREIHDKIPKKRKKLKPNEMKLILNWKLAGEAQVGFG